MRISISSPTMTLDMAYDPNKGGITTKTDVGTLMYSISGKPYAVSNINPVTSVVPVTLDSLTYTSFESVSTIEEGAYFASFVYNPEDQRAKMEVKQNGSVILTRWYLGSNYIKETSSGVTREYTFIGGNAYTAPVVSIKQNGVPTTYYLLRDHLGSITHVVNASTGSTTYEYSYDAWGRMRNTANWTNYSPGSEPVLFIAGRGFTGHEHLPWFNLINMNGRFYDQLTGQFLNSDNFIQYPFYTQSFNRYQYCLNNPLIYLDPSGFGSEKKKAVIKLDDEIEIVIDYLFNQLSETGGGGSLTYFPSSGYTIASPSGLSPGSYGPNNPYQLGEVTVTAAATTTTTNNINDIDPSDTNNSMNIGTDFLDKVANIGDWANIVLIAPTLGTDQRLKVPTKAQPIGYNLANELKVAKAMNTVSKYLNGAGKALGIVSYIDHSNQGWQSMQNGNVWESLGYYGLSIIDACAMLNRSTNPYILVSIFTYEIVDATQIRKK